jgi:hypothetical protein
MTTVVHVPGEFTRIGKLWYQTSFHEKLHSLVPVLPLSINTVLKTLRIASASNVVFYLGWLLLTSK